MGKHLQNFNEIENNLAIKIERIIRESRQAAYRAVNFTMVIAYWNIGKVIVEDELHWERAEYGWQKHPKEYIQPSHQRVWERLR